MPDKSLDKAFDEAKKRPAPKPYSIRFNWEEREELDAMADGQPWSAYIKSVLFVLKTRPKIRYSDLDRKQLAKLLGVLGRSRIASNLNQLAKAANSGSLAVNEEVTKALLEACRTIEWIKVTLINAMGLKAHSSSDTTCEKCRDDSER